MLKLHWWQVSRMPRSLLSEARHRPRAWFRAAIESRQIFKNFGDEMSRGIVESVFGQRVVWASPRSAELVAVGSILEHMLPEGRPLSVWGTGLRSPESVPDRFHRDLRFLAVRGHLTASSLGLEDNVTLGDPGLLADEVFGHKRSSAGRIYVPHFSELAEWTRVRQFCEETGMALVLPTGKTGDVVRRIGSAELVLSSSLHGIIVADSYGVPVIPLMPFTGLESMFKYRDYMDSTGWESQLLNHQVFVSATPSRRESVIEQMADQSCGRSRNVTAIKRDLRTAAACY